MPRKLVFSAWHDFNPLVLHPTHLPPARAEAAAAAAPWLSGHWRQTSAGVSRQGSHMAYLNDQLFMDLTHYEQSACCLLSQVTGRWILGQNSLIMYHRGFSQIIGKIYYICWIHCIFSRICSSELLAELKPHHVTVQTDICSQYTAHREFLPARCPGSDWPDPARPGRLSLLLFCGVPPRPGGGYGAVGEKYPLYWFPSSSASSPSASSLDSSSFYFLVALQFLLPAHEFCSVFSLV